MMDYRIGQEDLMETLDLWRDLIIAKLFRGTRVDFEDCAALVQREKMDFNRLEKRYRETAKYDVSEDRLLRNWDTWLKGIKKRT